MDLPEGHARDLLVAVAVVGGILLALYLYTGTWPPPVVIESNSMMHVNATEYEENFGTTRAEDVPYGRFGTVDPGDLVLVKSVDRAEEIETLAHDGEEHYGKPGEVVVYFKSVRKAGTPIIHRAVTYVTAVDSNGQTIHADRAERAEVDHYEVVFRPGWPTDVDCGPEGSSGPGADTCDGEATCRREDGAKICRLGDGGFRLPALARDEGFEDHVYKPEHSGFITQGDNEVGNSAPDQALGGRSLPERPVPIEQIQGVARAELPWFGLIKLSLTGDPASTSDVRDHPYYKTFGAMTAPQDLWVMLVVGLGVVTLVPVGMDYGFLYARRWWVKRQEETGDPAGGGNPSGGDGPDEPGPGRGGPPDADAQGDEPAAEADPEPGGEPAPGEDDDDERVEIHLE